MQPIEFWQLSDRLLLNEANPAGFRSVVSRDYYAAFHTSLRFLDEAGVVFPRTVKRGELHKHVPDILNNSGDLDVASDGTMLANLRDERNRADYDLADHLVENGAHATSRHMEAASIMGKLNTCRMTRGQIGGRFDAVAVALRQRAGFLFQGPSPSSPTSTSTSPPSSGS